MRKIFIEDSFSHILNLEKISNEIIDEIWEKNYENFEEINNKILEKILETEFFKN